MISPRCVLKLRQFARHFRTLCIGDGECAHNQLRLFLALDKSHGDVVEGEGVLFGPVSVALDLQVRVSMR